MENYVVSSCCTSSLGDHMSFHLPPPEFLLPPPPVPPWYGSQKCHENESSGPLLKQTKSFKKDLDSCDNIRMTGIKYEDLEETAEGGPHGLLHPTSSSSVNQAIFLTTCLFVAAVVSVLILTVFIVIWHRRRSRCRNRSPSCGQHNPWKDSLCDFNLIGDITPRDSGNTGYGGTTNTRETLCNSNKYEYTPKTRTNNYLFDRSRCNRSRSEIYPAERHKNGGVFAFPYSSTTVFTQQRTPNDFATEDSKCHSTAECQKDFYEELTLEDDDQASNEGIYQEVNHDVMGLTGQKSGCCFCSTKNSKHSNAKTCTRWSHKKSPRNMVKSQTIQALRVNPGSCQLYPHSLDLSQRDTNYNDLNCDVLTENVPFLHVPLNNRCGKQWQHTTYAHSRLDNVLKSNFQDRNHGINPELNGFDIYDIDNDDDDCDSETYCSIYNYNQKRFPMEHDAKRNQPQLDDLFAMFPPPPTSKPPPEIIQQQDKSIFSNFLNFSAGNKSRYPDKTVENYNDDFFHQSCAIQYDKSLNCATNYKTKNKNSELQRINKKHKLFSQDLSSYIKKSGKINSINFKQNRQRSPDIQFSDNPFSQIRAKFATGKIAKSKSFQSPTTAKQIIQMKNVRNDSNNLSKYGERNISRHSSCLSINHHHCSSLPRRKMPNPDDILPKKAWINIPSPEELTNDDDNVDDLIPTVSSNVDAYTQTFSNGGKLVNNNSALPRTTTSSNDDIQQSHKTELRGIAISNCDSKETIQPKTMTNDNGIISDTKNHHCRIGKRLANISTYTPQKSNRTKGGKPALVQLFGDEGEVGGSTSSEILTNTSGSSSNQS